jgi:hypothetical protein
MPEWLITRKPLLEHLACLLLEKKEILKEISALDGAFVMREDGIIEAAGKELEATGPCGVLPQGLGSRHLAAGITAVTKAVAVALRPLWIHFANHRFFEFGIATSEIRIVLFQKPFQHLYLNFETINGRNDVELSVLGESNRSFDLFLEQVQLLL